MHNYVMQRNKLHWRNASPVFRLKSTNLVEVVGDVHDKTSRIATALPHTTAGLWTFI